MATSGDLRRIALSLEGVTEAPHFDRTAFKVKRIFATLTADVTTANLKLLPEEQEFKVMMAPEVFRPVGNAWGRQGWTTIDLPRASEADLTAALELAWTRAANRASASTRAATPPIVPTSAKLSARPPAALWPEALATG